MRVVIIGATGNVGTSLLDALREEPDVEVVAVARRRPPEALLTRLGERATFVAADIVSDDLTPVVAGADAVVHLAWLIQPGRDESTTYAVNVTGSERVLAAVAAGGVRALVYASSIGTYSPGPKDRLVDEAWATDGIPTSFYSRHKVAVERMLDRFEHDRPEVRVVRMRPALIFKREAATEIRRLFAGPLLPRTLMRERLIPIVPEVPRLRFQVVHSADVGDAYRRAVMSDTRGAFNLAAEPVLGPPELGELLGARPVKVPAAVLRAGAALTYALRLQPTEPGWVDMGLGVPLIDSSRAHAELGWSPSKSAGETLLELLAGLREGSDRDTPPLARSSSGPGRLRELLTGLGARP